jgi:hypothetical protein
MKLRRQAAFNELVKNLYDQNNCLPYRERLVVMMKSEEATTLTLQFNNKNLDMGIGQLEFV